MATIQGQVKQSWELGHNGFEMNHLIGKKRKEIEAQNAVTPPFSTPVL
ncbi:hypothetical protein IMZ48_14280 [Candidatus Bathyarchaeota archaeon]|nr:hypothetical protein [Candidatus Bathyarchaeota archaeon]